jgi:release factor glutamine methyltransferase
VTRGELLEWVTGELESAQEARWLVEDAMGAPGPSGEVVDDRQRFLAQALVDRRLAGVPLQYVLGHWSFRGIELAVDPRVLIPRPETEQLVQVALEEIERHAGNGPLVLCDLGTGSGAIALAIANESGPQALEIWASDVDEEALVVARANHARLAGVGLLGASSMQFVQGSWFRPLPERLRGAVQIVVANPPYVSEDEWRGLASEVRLEPYRALVASAGSEGTPGLADVEAVLAGACDWLAPGGSVLIELAPHQAAAASQMAASLGLIGISVVADLSGRDRILLAHRHPARTDIP